METEQFTTATRLNILTLGNLKKEYTKLRKESRANTNIDAGDYLRGLTDFQLGVFIAIDSYLYGRPFGKAVENAIIHLEDKEKYINLVSRKATENLF